MSYGQGSITFVNIPPKGAKGDKGDKGDPGDSGSGETFFILTEAGENIVTEDVSNLIQDY